MTDKYNPKTKKESEKQVRERYLNLLKKKGQNAKKGLKKMSKFYGARKRRKKISKKNLPEEQKEKLRDYRRNYFITYNK